MMIKSFNTATTIITVTGPKRSINIAGNTILQANEISAISEPAYSYLFDIRISHVLFIFGKRTRNHTRITTHGQNNKQIC